MWCSTWLCSISLLALASLPCGRADYLAGVGIGDVTGPSAEINFMGYAKLQQSGEGIHLRQFSRAFIFEKDGARVVFVTSDIQAFAIGLKRQIISELSRRYGSLYSEKNVILSATHNHSGPGGFLMNLLFDLTILGFVKETFDAIVTGTVRSIVNAHENLQPARLFYGENQVLEASINRSPTSYLSNPQEERNKYKKDTEDKVIQLKIVDLEGNLRGVINWFAVHPVSMNYTNRLVSSDNVGYASLLIEKAINPKGTLPGKGAVVGAVAVSNLGDSSPNIKGPRCELTGELCDLHTSRCSKEAGLCFAAGPGSDHQESTRIIAERIAKHSIDILHVNDDEITGPIRFIHQFVDVPIEVVPKYDPSTDTFNPENMVSGCVAALGYSFAAGTTDGPGAFNFSQGTTEGNPLWDLVRDFIQKPTKEDIACHAPKPILLASGRIRFPYEWQPRIVETQLALIGNLAVAAVPGELTTMSGRRIRRLLAKTLQEGGQKDVRTVIAGLSNAYIHYITTPEEYQLQRYEGASNIFGPNTLDIFLHKYWKLASALMADIEVESGPSPPDLSGRLISLVPRVIQDNAMLFSRFGDVVKQPDSTYSPGQTATVKFVSGHPRNNLQLEKWYGAVEMLKKDGQWEVIATDASWETKFIWRRISIILGTSNVEFQWTIPDDAEEGTYRIRHSGHHRNLLGLVRPYHGVSQQFHVK